MAPQIDPLDHLLQPGRWLQGALAQDLLQKQLQLVELVPGQLLGAFRIERELGRGGMGIVYLAQRADGAFEQAVAIKWLPVGKLDSLQAAQFRHERQYLARLNHPNIARLLDGGCSEDGHLWFALEHVQGLPVDQHAAQRGLDWQARVRLLLPVVEAVQFAHGQLLVHRDIKPDNVLVDGSDQPKLIDFGVAYLLADAHAPAAFTPGFASPEQLQGEAVNTSSDIWQLGNLLLHVLQAATAEHPAPNCPADLLAVIAKAKQTDIALRYPSASALHADLLRALQYQPVVARPAGPTHRSRLLIRRHPLGSAISLLASLAFIGVVGGFLLRLTHERDNAKQAQTVTENVNAFLLKDFLPSADPLQGGASDLTVAELSERALGRVESRLGRLPEVAGRVESDLGDVLGNLGRYRSAHTAYTQAIAHLTTAFGGNDPRVLRTRLNLEKTNIDAASLQTADTRLQPLRTQILRSVGPHAPLLVEVDDYLARSAFLRDDFSLCKSRYTQLLAAQPNAQQTQLASILIGLSMCESRLGEWETALTHAKRARRIDERVLGPEHPLTLETHIAIESTLLTSGRYQESAQITRALIPKLTRLYGPQHQTTLTIQHDLGLATSCAGNTDEGVRLLRQVVADRSQELGTQHPWVAMSQSVLALALIQSGQLQEAASALMQARTVLAATEAPLPYVRLTLLQNEADLALAQGHASEAATRYRMALSTAHSLYSDNQRSLWMLRLGLGLALLNSDDAAQGRPLLQQALEQLGNRADCRSRMLEDARHQLAAGTVPHQSIRPQGVRPAMVVRR